MTKKVDNILEKISEKISPEGKIIEEANGKIKKFVADINKEIKKLNLGSEVFVGGSFAKKTLIKKDKYDIDVYLRYPGSYSEEEMEKATKKVVKGFRNVKRMHGSRDYYQINVSERIVIELVPVKKIKKSSEARNVTDLSYAHVKYINKKVKDEKILKEIRIAKTFCRAKGVYGAESYINGFSGYSLELLVYYYGGFEKFLREMLKVKERKIIDIEKNFRNKNEILMNLNESKLQSPVILIDPTFSQRNTLAALSWETFEKFREESRKFLKNPSEKHFEEKKVDLVEKKNRANKNGREFILIQAKISKPEGDIAGSKLKKFYDFLSSEFGKFFEIMERGFNYNEKKSARFYFVAKRKKEIVFEGPKVEDAANVKKFKRKHKNIFEKKGKIYAKEKIDFGIEEFLRKWTKKNSRRIREMYIESLKEVDV